MHHRTFALSLSLSLLPAACIPTTEGDTATTAGAPTCEPFAPYIIDIQAEPNGLVYRADQQQLYIADDDNNRVLVRSDDGATQIYAEIPNPSDDPGADGLGDLTFDADGALYVPRFGFGMPGLGALFRVPPGGQPEQLSGINDEWRRLGLDYDDARGRLYVATYTRDADDVYTGWVAVVDPSAGAESILVSGLSKPVGLAVIGDALFVADQDQRRLYRVDLTAATPALELLTDELQSLDLIEATPAGDLLVLGFDKASGRGRVYRVSQTGAYTVLAEGEWEPRGIAFDGVRRIFISARHTQTLVVVPAC
jgi:DNA-binding beta-propeller fold protein YncE